MPTQAPMVSRTGQRSIVPVIALVALVVVASALSGPWIITSRTSRTGSWFGSSDISRHRRNLTPQTVPSHQPGKVAGLPAEQWPWVRGALVLLALVALTVVVIACCRHLISLTRRGAPGDDAITDTALPDDAVVPALHDAFATAERHLTDVVGPPGDAVIAAWVALEDAAGQTGVRRDPVATPTEFTVAVLDTTRADPAAIRVLLALYLTARFSEHPLTTTDVDRARESLRALAAGLTTRRADDAATT